MKSFLIFLGMLFSYNTMAQDYDSQCKNKADGSLILVDFKSDEKLILREDYFGVSDFSSKVTLKKAGITGPGKASFQYLGSKKEIVISHDEAVKNFKNTPPDFELEVKQVIDGRSLKTQKYLCRLYR